MAGLRHRLDGRSPSGVAAWGSGGQMRAKDALSVSIGVLGALAVVLTETAVKVPVWVLFIAWASFFVLGGGPNGFVRSLAANIAGIVIATATLLVIAAVDGGTAIAAIAVGLGS